MPTQPCRAAAGLIASLLLLLAPFPGPKDEAPAAPYVPRPNRRADEPERLYRQATDVYLGLTGPVDQKQALKLFRQAAERGHALALGEVGCMLLTGQGCARDKEEGLRLIRQAVPAIR